jgi:single-strand DNA-binding protein
MNKVILLGNLGRDPEVRYSQSGTAIANFSFATSEKRKDEKHTEWHNIVAFNRQAEVIGEYCKKGDKIAIEGRMQTRDWEDRDGAKRRTTEIILDRFEFVGSSSGAGQEAKPKPESGLGTAASKPFDDEISF